MPIPDYQSFFVPVLRLVADGGEHPMAGLRDAVAAGMKLTEEDLEERIPSGTQTVFSNRLAWACVYLAKAGALERVRRGVFRITQRGRELLAPGEDRITVRHLARYPEFVAFQRGSRSDSTEEREALPARSETPEEQLEAVHSLMRAVLANEVLDAVKRSSAAFFEKLVVDLLVAMGYGGSIEEAGKVVGRPGDEGIDGVIKEDKLGLDVVYVQAKKWTGVVGRKEVQAFAGSLEGARAKKGVFLTTSAFSKEAVEYVRRIEKRIVLIDGEQLAGLMIEHDVGVKVTRTYKVKKLDSDYLDEG